MLDSILNHYRAIIANIQFVRIFTRMHQLLESHKEILRKLKQIEKKELNHDWQILLIFEYISQVEQARQQQEQSNLKRIGFR